MSQRAKLTRAKIVLLGAPSVGKTAFAVRFITRRFIGEYDANKEMIYHHKSLLDKEEVLLEIVDTSNVLVFIARDNTCHFDAGDAYILVSSNALYSKVHITTVSYNASFSRYGDDGMPSSLRLRFVAGSVKWKKVEKCSDRMHYVLYALNRVHDCIVNHSSKLVPPIQDEGPLEQHIRTADGFIILYSVVERDTYSSVDRYMSRVQHVRHADNSRGFLPLVLVATKTDLEHVRKVTEDETVSLGRRYGSPTYEVSVAENPDGVSIVMQDLLRQIKREFLRNLAGFEKRASPLDNMKRVFKKKITRSKSDTVC